MRRGSGALEVAQERDRVTRGVALADTDREVFDLDQRMGDSAFAHPIRHEVCCRVAAREEDLRGLRFVVLGIEDPSPEQGRDLG
jgi:hypothetical protein